MKLVKGKMVGRILERAQGFSSWIKFGVRGLALLLEGMEACCKRKLGKSFKMAWNEGVSDFKLKLC